MIRRLKVIQIFLISAISVLIFGLPFYHSYTSLVETGPFSADLNIENPDQDVPMDLQQAELKISVSCVFSVVLPPGTTLLNGLQSLCFQIASFDQRALVLRC
jgi:hypothetical protein